MHQARSGFFDTMAAQVTLQFLRSYKQGASKPLFQPLFGGKDPDSQQGESCVTPSLISWEGVGEPRAPEEGARPSRSQVSVLSHRA